TVAGLRLFSRFPTRRSSDLGVFVGTGTTAFAAGETMTTYMIDLPRASDPNKAGWGHPALNFLGGWSTGENDSFSVHTQDAFNGRSEEHTSELQSRFDLVCRL